jgi:hypothetical protein
MRAVILLLFAASFGLVLSGIVANLYRLLARKPRRQSERMLYLGIMVLAGPSVLLDNATRSFRRKDCSSAAYAFALGLCAYWSFALGLALMALAAR